jgi:hypothetical protein
MKFKGFVVLFWTLAGMFMLLGIARGEYLACDLPGPGVAISETEVEITTTATGVVVVVPGLAQARPAEFLLLDLSALQGNDFRFRARWKTAGSLFSGWSVFLDAARPGGPGGLRVVR